MAYENGVAAGHHDLLDKLVIFLTTNADLTGASPSQAWSINRDATPPHTYTTGVREVQLVAPGMSAVDAFYCAIVSMENVPIDVYNWKIRGQIGYMSSRDYDTQPGVSPECVVSLWDQAIPYWFVASGRRVIVVAKISTVYISFYLGCILPYATPGQYPYPFIVSGNVSWSSTNGGGSPQYNQRWSSIDTYNAGNANFFNCGSGGMRLHWVDGSWQNCENIDWPGGSPTSFFNTFPYFGGDSNMQSYTANMRECIDGTYMLNPIELVYSAANVGVFEGVYHISGFDNASEDIITVAGQPYLVFQNVYRTGRSDYAAIKLL